MPYKEEYDTQNCRIAPNWEIYYCKRWQSHEDLASEIWKTLYQENTDREFLHAQGWVRRSNTVYQIDWNPLVPSYTENWHQIELTDGQIKSIQKLSTAIPLQESAKREIAKALETRDPISASRERIFGPWNYS